MKTTALIRRALSLAALGLLAAHGSPSADPFQGLAKSCGTCHALAKPVQGDALEHIWKRKGPDLHYAGEKFNREWLVRWLQKPTTIRPAGIFYHNSVKPAAGADAIDSAALPPHPRLDAADAAKAADALMALKGSDGAIAKGAFAGGKPNLRFGEMAFTKLRGCSACHQYADGKGGSSGTELKTAGARLQPDYIASYIKHPQKIDPGIWMPVLEMSDADVQRLTAYLLSLGAEKKQ